MDKSPEQISQELCEALTLDYRGRNTNVNSDGSLDIHLYNDIDRMAKHPVCAEAMRIFEGGLASAEFEVIKASSSQVGDWALKSIERFWENDLHQVQLSYRYGWQGCEILYREEGEMLSQVGLKVFHPADTRPVKAGQAYAGIRVRNLAEKGAKVLRCAGRWPGKAFWHGHEVAYDRFYGVSQFHAAHQDWKRLAEQRGTEEMLDIAITRTGVPGPEVRFPTSGNVIRRTNGELDYTPARNAARKIVDDWLSGMSMLMPSERDDKGNPLWEVKWPTATLNADGMLSVIKHYESRICYGIGTPRELMESVDTGGWAGRNITMETFLRTQERIGRQILFSWYTQIGEALAKFHFGPDASFALKMKGLNESRMQPGMEQPGTPLQGQQPGQGGQRPVGNMNQPTSRFSLPTIQQPQRPKLMGTEYGHRKIKTSPLLQ
ncbi:MAG: hypothetical protein JNJ77_20035 [Planctomycetia bacterium]|nr:hypothetical protein [Planctomycetia bacterium]